MHQNARLDTILEAALAGRGPTRADATFLLGLPQHSAEARQLMAVADQVTRRRFHNEAVLLGQIGIETAPCKGDCKFCSFSRTHGEVPAQVLSPAQIAQKAQAFTQGGELYALFLMTMHDWDFGALSEAIVATREVIPAHTRLVVNVGDFGFERAVKLRELGVSGAYHVLRLREGTDTALRPEGRLRTMDAIRETRLDLYYCTEPVGPEHGPEELVEQMYAGIERGCFQHAAMRRVNVPGSPLEERGQITNLRLAQVTSVVALASLGSAQTTNIAVHEPNLLGLVAGANAIYAETGANPRDPARDTESHRGLDVAGARTMLLEAGFTHLRRGDGSKVALTDRRG